MKTLSTISALFAAAAALSHNVLLVGASGKHGETVTFGDRVFELTTGPAVTAGRFTVDLSASAAALATQTLTTTGNAVADETVTIGSRTYTWKAAVDAANQVKVGATAAESLDNLVAAVMAGAGAGTLYGAGTVVHADVTAVRASATLVATAKIKGTAGNALASTETMTLASWGAATFAGGLDATATQTRDAILAAFNANIPASVSTAFTGGLVIVDSDGRGVKATTETLAGAGNAWQFGATTIGFDNGGAIPNLSIVLQRAVTAAEATANRFIFALPGTPTAYAVQVRTAAGVVKAWDGALTLIGNCVQLDNAGSVDLAENDVVTLTFAV